MDYSPKLKKVMEEIKSILKKNDVAAVIVLHTVEGQFIKDGKAIVKGYSEYTTHIRTSYSAASVNSEKFVLNGKFKTADEKAVKIASTVNMIKHLTDITCRNSLQLVEMESMLENMVGSYEHEGKNTEN